MSNSIIEDLYEDKDLDYFSLEREIFKTNITSKNLKILDVGCGSGNLGHYFITQQNCEVHGIEINKNAYSKAKVKLHKVIHANIETENLEFKEDCFDVIILGDVLEHLVNPQKVLIKLHKHLAPSGTIFITTPNVKHWSVSLNLIFKDNWDYKEWGILDYTHLRFFTRSSVIKMLKSLNFNTFNVEWHIQSPSKSSKFNKLTLNIFKGFLASHLIIKIKK